MAGEHYDYFGGEKQITLKVKGVGLESFIH